MGAQSLTEGTIQFVPTRKWSVPYVLFEQRISQPFPSRANRYRRWYARDQASAGCANGVGMSGSPVDLGVKDQRCVAAEQGFRG